MRIDVRPDRNERDSMKQMIVMFALVVGGAAIASAQGNEQGGVTGKRQGAQAVEKLLMETDVTEQTKAREAVADDPYRPLYHVSAPGRGLHDPAGLCWWNGYYHFFYLSVGNGWGRHHAVSKDLVHWQDLPPLPPHFKGGTGQALADSDRVILGLRGEERGANTRFATSSAPLLLDWAMPDPVPDNAYGDNQLWKDGDYYYAAFQVFPPPGPLVFKGNKNFATGKTQLKLMRSKDLEEWEDLGMMLEDGLYPSGGEDSACPNFLPISENKWLLLYYTHKSGPRYYVGDYNKETFRFSPDRFGKMNFGPVLRGSLHAPSALIDEKGRCVGIWNVTENIRKSKVKSVGVMSLPRQISLNGAEASAENFLNPLRIEPLEELKRLRRDSVEIKDLAVPANEEVALENVKGKAMEIEVEIDPMEAREVGLNVFRSPDAREMTSVSLFMDGWPRDENARELMIDVSKASLNPDVYARSPEVGPVTIKDGETIKLRIFLDRSIIEVFANGIQCLTLRAYPTLENSNGVSVFSRGGEAKLVSLEAHQMGSIWPELEHKVGK